MTAKPTRLIIASGEPRVARQTAEALLTDWNSQFGAFAAIGKVQHVVPLVHGLAAFAHECGQSYLDLLDAGRGLTGAGLVRSAYESALTSLWLVRMKDAALAFVNEELRQRRSLATTLRNSGLGVDEDVITAIGRDGFVPFDSLSNARRFDLICKDLNPGGDQAYWYYRVLSGLTHPSLTLVDRYLIKAPTHEEDPVGLSLQPR